MTAGPFNFALIGAAGYVAPRHLKAIFDTGNRLVAALDRSDSVGVLDRFDWNVAFFTEFERFDRHADKLRRAGEQNRIHYVSICSPNYLHDAHVRFALRVGADAICEKPLVLNPWNLDALADLERESGRRVHTVLQLRLHPAVAALKARVAALGPGHRHDVELTYVTARGAWYFTSWKGDPAKSGGVGTNIGIHFFDMLLWVFGGPQAVEVHEADASRMSGYLELERARVRWFLSVSPGDLPEEARTSGRGTWRSMRMDGEEFDFSEGFADLHTATYDAILGGRGAGLEDARPSIELAYRIRNAAVVPASSATRHPFAGRARGGPA